MTNKFLQFEKCYLDSIKIVLNHESKKELLIAFGSFFKKIEQQLQGKLEVINILAGAAPELPRVRILSKEIILSFSLNRVEIEVKGFRKHSHVSSIFDLYKNKLKEAETLIAEYLSQDTFIQGFIGVVSNVRFPQDMNLKKEQIIEALYSKIKTADHKKPLTFSFRIGFLNKSEDKFINYDIREYQLKNLRIAASKIEVPLTIEVNTLPTAEHGILTIIDINNRPQKEVRSFSQNLDEVLTCFFSSLESIENIF